MKIISRRNDPKFVLEFTPQDVGLLSGCAALHYDRACRLLGEPGGIVYGMRNHSSLEVGRREVDLLCKVLEQSASDETGLYEEMAMLLAMLDDEAAREIRGMARKASE
jgi:hypothetical protein